MKMVAGLAKKTSSEADTSRVNCPPNLESLFPMIAKILLTLAVILGLIAVVAAFQPAHYRVERSVIVAAPAASVFAQTNDLHKYQTWNPFGKSDPAAVYTHSGPTTGTGAVLKWTSTGQTGEGTMTIVESRPTELVRYRLDFVRPMAGTAVVAFTIKPEGNQTRVTWGMEGEKNFISKVIGLFVSMDKMIGGAFEGGLVDLKTIVEAEAKK